METDADAPIKVFLAEDDIDDQELLKEIFLEIDPSIELVSYSTGRQFVTQLEGLSQKPRLLILDYNIPEMNGAEILKYLNQKDEFHDTVKIVWSTSNSPFYMNSCLTLGAHAYFVKPASMDGLYHMARQMLGYL